MALNFQTEATAKLIGKFGVPYQGTWNTLPSNLLPLDVLADSLNISIQRGILESRAGLEPFDPTVVGEIIGANLFVSKTATTVVKNPVAVSASKFWVYDGFWQDKTGFSTLSAGTSSRVRMTNIAIGTNFYMIVVNNSASIYVYNGISSLTLVTATSGIIPSGITDICTAGLRLVAIVPPYQVIWSENLSYTDWPTLNTNVLLETPGSIVAIRNLGTLGFVVYKEDSVYTAFLQSASSAAAFRFEFRGQFEGPCNPDAIVDANGIHYGFTPSGRIFRFDGSEHSFVCDGIWPTIRDTLDTAYLYKVHGTYNYKSHELTFWYPRIGDTGLCKGMITIALPYPLSGIKTVAYFHGLSAFSCTASLGNIFFQNTADPLVFGNSKSYRQNHLYYRDEFTEIPLVIQHGFIINAPRLSTDDPQKDYSGGDILQPAYEPYFRKGEDKGLINLQSVVSSNLETNLGEYSPIEEIDLVQIYPNAIYTFELQGTYISLRITCNATALLEYLGCDIYARVTT